ncbi:hypothetical protein FS749_004196 [Ceratobasidium sp. UAMH 11750]|nr:hypothetical protein FS749_004196 [Ceratobasidium sp. UAMH 11750]
MNVTVEPPAESSASSSRSSSHEWEQLGPSTLLSVPEETKSTPRLGSLSPLVVVRNLRARASISNLLQTTPEMMATTAIDARSPQSTRQAILGFMGRRARSATTGTPPVNTANPSPPLPSPGLPGASLGLSGVEQNHHHLHIPSLHRNAHPSPDPAPDAQPAQGSGRLGGILRRRRSNGGDVSPSESPALDASRRAASQQAQARTQAPSAQRSASTNAVPQGASPAATGPAHRLRLVPHLDPSARTLHFEPIVRDVREGGPVLRIGRFTDRFGVTARQPDSTRIAFKSKVVSRAPAEVWCVPGGKFMIRDTRSSSGTFLNHTRLSAPNIESRPQELHDGDIIQLGVDYQGGTEEIYRCVKIRVEVGREWQREANGFNTGALKQLQTLQGKGKETPRASHIADPSNSRKTSVADCCICLFPVAILQSLFIAPCSHCFHYKCIRPLLIKHHPGFSCPLCRTFADLEEDVENERAPSIYAPSVCAPSVHEVEGVSALVTALAANAESNNPGPSPKALPAVPVDDASINGSGSGLGSTVQGRATPTQGSLTDMHSRDGLRSELAIHSDGGSTPRGSTEDLRAAQREMGDRTLTHDDASANGVPVPRTPERERDILNSATPLNNQFLALTSLPVPALPSIPSIGNIAAIRLTSDSCSSLNVTGDARDAYGDRDTESARYLLLEGEEDDGDDGDDDDDEMVVINGMKRMSVRTEGAAGPSRGGPKEPGVAI